MLGYIAYFSYIPIFSDNELIFAFNSFIIVSY